MDYSDDEIDDEHDWKNCPRCKLIKENVKLKRNSIVNEGCKMINKNYTVYTKKQFLEIFDKLKSGDSVTFI